MKNNKTYVFDIDGTLTPHRQYMTDEFFAFFKQWKQNNRFYLATGSDFGKVQEQLPEEVIEAAQGIFCCMGNQLFVDGGKHLIYQNCFVPEDKLTMKLDKYLEYSEYPTAHRAPPHFEYRVGMLNFSVAGRGSDHESRYLYSEYDRKTREREVMSETLRAQFPGLDFVVGGKISIDIFERGNDKSQVIDWILNNDRSRLVYIGDRAYEGGNDHAAVAQIDDQRAGTWFNVSSWKETMAILRISNLVNLKDGITKK